MTISNPEEYDAAIKRFSELSKEKPSDEIMEDARLLLQELMNYEMAKLLESWGMT